MAGLTRAFGVALVVIALLPTIAFADRVRGHVRPKSGSVVRPYLRATAKPTIRLRRVAVKRRAFTVPSTPTTSIHTRRIRR